MEVDVQIAIDESDPSGYNLIGEIPGTDLADEVVAIGAHLDSWHSGTGATDNASGVSVMMETMRILQALEVQPRRTIRILLWSHEEGGLRGSRGYVRNHMGNPQEGTTPAYDAFSVYFNMDNGTGQFRGVHLQGNTEATPIFEQWMKPFQDLGVGTLSQFSNMGTDHLSFTEAGLPGFQFVQDRIDYRARTHHFNADTFDKLLPRDLKINSSVVASFAYQAAMRDGRFPRPRTQ
jgi:Zn-dependent M28 family amino/carboxypeptidase